MLLPVFQPERKLGWSILFYDLFGQRLEDISGKGKQSGDG
jgi:hypothetical protein